MSKSQHANVHIGQIVGAFTEQCLRVTGELLPMLEHHEVERLFRGIVLTDVALDLGDQHVIFEDEELGIENRRFFRAGGQLRACADMP